MPTAYYRIKPADPSQDGGFFRAVGSAPLEEPGLTDGVTYQWDDGTDKANTDLPEIMPGVAPSVVTAPTLTGTSVGEIPVVTQGVYSGSPTPTITPGDLLLDGTIYGGPSVPISVRQLTG